MLIDYFNAVFNPKDLDCELLYLKILMGDVRPEDAKEVADGLGEIYGVDRVMRVTRRIEKRLKKRYL